MGSPHFTGLTVYVSGLNRPFKFLLRDKYDQQRVQTICHYLNDSCHNLPAGRIFDEADSRRLCCVRRNKETRTYPCAKHCTGRPTNGLKYIQLASKETYLDRVPTNLIMLITKYMCTANSMPFEAPLPETLAPYCNMCAAVTNQLLSSCGGEKRSWNPNLQEARRIGVGEKRPIECIDLS
jgi:hypothetical protein